MCTQQQPLPVSCFKQHLSSIRCNGTVNSIQQLPPEHNQAATPGCEILALLNLINLGKTLDTGFPEVSEICCGSSLTGVDIIQDRQTPGACSSIRRAPRTVSTARGTSCCSLCGRTSRHMARCRVGRPAACRRHSIQAKFHCTGALPGLGPSMHVEEQSTMRGNEDTQE